MITRKKVGGYRMAKNTLPEAYRVRLRAIVAQRGQQRTAADLRSSDHVIEGLAFGGFAMGKTVARIMAALDALSTPASIAAMGVAR